VDARTEIQTPAGEGTREFRYDFSPEVVMLERMLSAVGNRTYRHVGELTNTHPETVRRYLQGQVPSVEFVASLSKALGVSADWLLTGRGPMKNEDLRAHALAQADASELLTAMADTMERLIDRVERLELYVQTLEARVRSQPPGIRAGGQIPAGSVGRERANPMSASETIHVQAQVHTSEHATGTGYTASPAAQALGIHHRAQRLSDALSQRTRPDAG
jgi:transcriptional regulator with XRE-family HTH domain